MTTNVSNTLRVDTSTTLSQLQEFSGKARLDDSVRARKVDGGWELFARDTSKGGFFKQALDAIRAPYQRHQAAQAIRQITENHQRQTGLQAGNVLTHAITTPFGGDLKAAVLSFTAGADNKRDIASDASLAEVFTPAPDSEAFHLDDASVKASISSIGARLAAGEDPKALAEELGDTLRKGFELSSPSAQTIADFGTCHPVTLRSQVAALLMEAVPDDQKKGLENKASGLASDALHLTAAATQTDRFDGADTFTLNGKTYVSARPEPLGEGGFGVVREFRCVEDGSRVAVKIGHPAVQTVHMSAADVANKTWSNLDAAMKEIALHGRAEGEGHANMTHMLGGVRHPTAGMAIVLELAPHGTTKGFGEKIDRAVSAGVISFEDGLQAKRGMARDMLQGVAHSHANGMLNQDVKDENFLIGEDGTVKLADNGGAREAKGYNNVDVGAHTLAFISPEALDASITSLETRRAVGHLASQPGIMLGLQAIPAKTPLEAATPEDVPETPSAFARPVFSSVGPSALAQGVAATERNPVRAGARQALDTFMPHLNEQEKNTLLSSFLSNFARDRVDRGTDPVKRDAYAAGLAARTLLYSRNDGALRVSPGENGDARRTLDALAGLMDGLSHADVHARLTPQAALGHDAVALTPEQVTSARETVVKVANWARGTAAGPLPVLQTSVRSAPPSTVS